MSERESTFTDRMLAQAADVAAHVRVAQRAERGLFTADLLLDLQAEAARLRAENAELEAAYLREVDAHDVTVRENATLRWQLEEVQAGEDVAHERLAQALAENATLRAECKPVAQASTARTFPRCCHTNAPVTAMVSSTRYGTYAVCLECELSPWYAKNGCLVQPFAYEID